LNLLDIPIPRILQLPRRHPPTTILL
jgi:hypothetical protein